MSYVIVLSMTGQDMNGAIEKLKALRQKKAQSMAGWRNTIASLQDELANAEAQIIGIDESIKELSGGTPPMESTPPLIGKYAKMGLTPAILDVLENAGDPPGLSAPEIMERLKAEGFKTTAKNLYASVYSVSLGLVEAGKAREGKKDGRRTFMKK
jgi:hypothetical protein